MPKIVDVGRARHAVAQRRTEIQRVQRISAAIATHTIACHVLQPLDTPIDLNEGRSNWPRPLS